jgi:hypothetical protein
MNQMLDQKREGIPLLESKSQMTARTVHENNRHQ